MGYGEASSDVLKERYCYAAVSQASSCVDGYGLPVCDNCAR